jgi:hypothetical protein
VFDRTSHGCEPHEIARSSQCRFLVQSSRRRLCGRSSIRSFDHSQARFPHWLSSNIRDGSPERNSDTERDTSSRRGTDWEKNVISAGRCRLKTKVRMVALRSSHCHRQRGAGSSPTTHAARDAFSPGRQRHAADDRSWWRPRHAAMIATRNRRVFLGVVPQAGIEPATSRLEGGVAQFRGFGAYTYAPKPGLFFLPSRK